jgi:hypothetical protein
MKNQPFTTEAQRHRGRKKQRTAIENIDPAALQYKNKRIALVHGWPFASVSLYPQGVGRGCKGLKPQQHTLCLCGEWSFSA